MARTLRFILPFERWSGKIAPKKQQLPAGPGVIPDRFIQGSPCVTGVVRTNELGTKQFYRIRIRGNATHTLGSIEQAARERFRSIAARVRTAYATPATLTSYKLQYQVCPIKDKITLRKFIWDAEAALYDAEQNG